MEIQSLATGMAQSRIQEEAAISVQAMVLQNARDTSADLARVMESSQPAQAAITDPTRGNFLDVMM